MVSVKSAKKILKKEKVKFKKGNIKKDKLKRPKQISISKPPQTPEITKVNSSNVAKKKSVYIMPSRIIDDTLVTSCLNALDKIVIHQDQKNAIFGDENQIFLEIRCIKIPNKKKNIKFILPHSTVSMTGEVCLVTPDLKKGKKKDHEPTIDHWEEILRTAEIKSVKTVLPMRQLRVEYDQYELKRRLLTQHDFIMVDNRVLNHVSHILGKKFFQKHNMLIPVKIDEKKNLKKSIDTGLRTVMLRLSEGQTSTVIVGHTAMLQSHLKENILALVNKLNEKFPGGEANIRSLSIKLPLSLSLPLYLTLRPSSSIPTPRLKQSKPKDYITYEGELTTKPGSIVRVAPDGTVHLKKSTKTKAQGNKREFEEDEDSNNEDSSDSEDNN